MIEMSEKDKKIALTLSNYEKLLDDDSDLPDERRAQCYVCLAHDWYHLKMGDEARRLLKKANQVFPGYFKRAMIQHTIESKDFDFIVKTLTIDMIEDSLENEPCA